MLPEKIKKIIHSCNTIPQLETCIEFVEYIYSKDHAMCIEALNEIQIRSEHLAICGVKGMAQDYLDTHQMD